MLFYYLQMIETKEERDKLEQIYKKYRNLMFSITRELLENQQDEEDAVQKAFEAIAKNLDRVGDVDSRQTRSYVAIITRRKAIDILRKRYAVQIIPYEEYMGETIMQQLPGDNRLAAALARLPAHYRDFLLLHYDNGYTYKEIGKMVGKSSEAVRQTIQRARRQLDELLKKEDDCT